MCDVAHVTLRTRPSSRFSACNIEKLGMGTRLSAVSMSTGKTELIDVRNEALAELFRYEDEVNEDVDMIDITLYVKDWYNIARRLS